MGDVDSNGTQLRPHIVWFGEAVPMLDRAINICNTADILLIIGTSMQVYPAASLINYVPDTTSIYFIDPNPALASSRNITVITKTATAGVKSFMELVKASLQ